MALEECRSSRRRDYYLVAFFLVAAIGFARLSEWQFAREAWKTRLLDHLTAAWRTPLDHPLRPSDFFPDPVDDTYFRRGQITGTLLLTETLILKPRRLNEQVGGNVLTPLRLTDGTQIWVDRGFVPEGVTPPSSPPSSAPVVVRGLVYVPDWRGLGYGQDGKYHLFTPLPASDHLPTPTILRALAPIIPGDGITVIEAQPTFPNNHRQYALFWTGMAGLSGFYALGLGWRSKRSR